MTRITNSMLVNNYMNNMQRNLSNMSTLQNQLASGKTIQRASENPYVAVRTMQLNTEITANKQYNSNITDVTNWLDTTDTALGQANNVIKRIKELMVKAGNGSYGADEIGAVKDEVVEKVKELGQIMNTTFDGNYIFGGTKSTTKPVTWDDDGNLSFADKSGNSLNVTLNDKGEVSQITDSTGTVLSGDDLKNAKISYEQISAGLKTEISDGVNITYNKTAADITTFKDSAGKNQNMMTQLSDIVKLLNVASGSSTSEKISTSATPITSADDALKAINSTYLNSLDAISQNMLTLRSNVGAMENRMESAKTTNEDQNYNMTSILSETDDIDFTEKTMEYSVLQTVYTATLQVSAKVLKNTLMDYV